MTRPQYRWTTEGSSKWANGHNAGCVFHAPPDKCICAEFDLEEDSPMTTKDDSYEDNLTAARVAAANERAAFWDGLWLGGVIGAGLMLFCFAIAYFFKEVIGDLR